MPVRRQTFRSPSSDVISVCDRSNVDFRVMERGFPDGGDENVQLHADVDSLSRCFTDIPFVGLSLPLVRRMAYSVVALHVASHNCDYYITKYATKPLEQLQNLVTQYAVGLRRLEVEEAADRAQATARGQDL